MVLGWDVRKDGLTTADGWERVYFLPRAKAQQTRTAQSPAGPEGYPVQGLRGVVSWQEAAPSQGQYTAAEVVWQLAAEGMPGVPSPGDLLIDTRGVSYRVLQTAVLERTGRYRCVCRHLAVAEGLETLVDIERAQRIKSADGVEVLQWSVWRSGVRAKLQMEQCELQKEGDRILIQARWKIYFAETFPLDLHCRIRGPDGTRYRIVALRGQERIDGLMEADLEPV